MSQVSAHIDGSDKSFDRRVHGRHQVRSLAYVELGEGNGGIVLNVCESGIAVQAVTSLMGDEVPCVRVQLSHSKKRIEAKGRIAWTSGLRKTAGIEFMGLSQEARSLLREWVALEAPAHNVSEQTTGLIENGVVQEPASGRLGSDGLTPAAAATLTNLAAKIARLPSESQHTPEPVSRLTSPPFDAVPVPTRAVARSAPVRREASSVSPVQATPAVTLATASATSAPPVEPDQSGIVPRTSATTPSDRLGSKSIRTITKPPQPAAASSTQRWKLPVLVAGFAAVSLATGWFAGNGALHGVFKKSSSNTPAENVEMESAPDEMAPANLDVSNIDAVDLNHQHWIIPMDGPLTPPTTLALRPADNSPTQLDRNKNTRDIAPPVAVPPTAQTARGEDKTMPPARVVSSVPATNAAPVHSSTNLRPANPPPPRAQVKDGEASDLQPGTLVHRVEPTYPPSALAERVEGTVLLYAVIDANGTVRELQPLNGPPALIPAALAAVRQWRYSPSLQNGRPIQTERQIKIVFQLSESP